MKLYLVHCGFYDQALAEGGRNIFEGHHEVETVDGWKVVLEPAPGDSKIVSTGYDEAKAL